MYLCVTGGDGCGSAGEARNAVVRPGLTRAWSRRGDPRGSGLACVPGMAQNSRGGSPRARYQRSRRLGEGQGRSSRGGVWRKPNPNVRGDVQEPDMRCGTPGTSGHVTTKSSIRVLGVLYKSGVYARTVLCLTLGDLHAVRQRGELSEEESEPTGMQKSAEGIVGPAQARLVRHPKAERRGNG
jgi:hypothetical protein